MTVTTHPPAFDPYADPNPLPQSFARSPFEQYVAWPGIAAEDDISTIDLVRIAGEHGTYADFAQWCSDLGIAPQHWPDMWKACDGSDGVSDSTLRPALDFSERYNQSKRFEDALAPILDPDGNGVVDPREYSRLTGTPAPAEVHRGADRQMAAYVITDMNQDGRVNGLDHDVWEQNWAQAHNGVSFYAEPGNAPVRAQAIANGIVAQGKTFNLFGEIHLMHPWAEIAHTIQALRAQGKPVFYTVELDRTSDLEPAARYIDALAQQTDLLKDPAVFKAAVMDLADLLDRAEGKDYAHSIVAALRDGAQVAFIDADTTPAGRTRDDIMTERLLALQAAHPDAVFVCHLGAYHTSQHDYAPEAVQNGSNLDCRAVARRLMDAHPASVLSMSYTPTVDVTADRVVDKRVYDLSFTIPWSGGLNHADSWYAAGWRPEAHSR